MLEQIPRDTTTLIETLLKDRRQETAAIESEGGRIIPWVFHRNGSKILDIRGAGNRPVLRLAFLVHWFTI